MYQNDIESLVERYLNGTITPSEKKILLAWYRDRAEQDAEWLMNEADQEQLVKQRMFHNIASSIAQQQPRRVKRIWYYSAAAVILLAISASLFLFKAPAEELPLSVVKNELYKNDVPFGSDKAMLTLADGRKIALDDVAAGTIGRQGKVLISKLANGKLAYNGSDAGIQYNTISTPKGGQYQIMLADGTKVWLNAATDLKFPAAFTGNTREVQLDGEAYFEVAKDKTKPFRVLVNNAYVEVLGTHFNVTGYADDSHTATTLLEGSVRFVDGANQALLKPGQRSTLNNTTKNLSVTDADAEEAVAWKNGYFLFANEDVKSIMQKLSRWYDIDVRYDGNVSGKAVFGTMSRYKNISEVLNMIEQTGVVKFKIEGRRITVMP